jgi:hypothetical protein
MVQREVNKSENAELEVVEELRIEVIADDLSVLDDSNLGSL